MIVPTNPGERIDLILDYLLDELPDTQTAAIDRELFDSEELTATFAEYKADLIDSYADGRLTASQKERFQRLLLVDPGMRELLPFAHALVSVKARTDDAPAQSQAGGAGRRLVYVAALLAIAATLVVVIFTQRPHSSGVSGPQPPPTIAAESGQHGGSVYPVILSPAVLRGGGETDVRIPALTDTVRLQILLPAESDGAQYTVTLNGRDHAFQRLFPNLKAMQAGPERYVEVSVASGDLQVGEYKLLVSDQNGMLVHLYPLKIGSGR